MYCLKKLTLHPIYSTYISNKLTFITSHDLISSSNRAIDRDKRFVINIPPAKAITFRHLRGTNWVGYSRSLEEDLERISDKVED